MNEDMVEDFIAKGNDKKVEFSARGGGVGKGLFLDWGTPWVS